MGKKTSSASSESVRMSSNPVNSPSTESLDQSEADISIDGQNEEKGEKKEKLGLIKRMSIRREKKKDKEKEKQAEKERVKEKAKEEKEKAKEEKEKAKEEKAKGKSKSKDKGKDKDDSKNKDESKAKDKTKEKDKTKDKDKRKEEGQKNTTDKIYRKISMDDFEGKQTEFKLWMLEQQNGSVDNMKASKVKSFFKKFVKEWNKKNLPHRYYWSSEDTPPPSRAGSRFSFAEEVQTPDYLNFPAAPVDLSNDDLDSEDGISRSESFSTFGKTQKPEGLNDEVTPTMPKRPLLSAVFPAADNSVNSGKISPTLTKMLIKPVVICEDVDEPATPTPQSAAFGPSETPPSLLTYEQSPGLLNGTLKERYAITPDNNNIRKSPEIYEVQTSNYICMEDNILPGEELQVTQMLERAIMDEGLSGELTPIAEEDAHNLEAKHGIAPSTVAEALQPVVEKQTLEIKVETEDGAGLVEESTESTWQVINSEAQNGQVTFSGLPPPPKQWKMDSMGLTNTILPPVRQTSQEKTTTSTEVTTVPVTVKEETDNQIQNITVQRTTITTVQQVTQPKQTTVTEEKANPPVITSTVIMQNSPQSPIVTTEVERQEDVSYTTRSPQSVVYTMEEVHSPTVKSPVVTLQMKQPPSPAIVEAPVDVHYDRSPVIKTQTIVFDRKEETTAPQPVRFVSEEIKVKSPVSTKEVAIERSPERSTVLAPSTVTIHQESVSIPATSHITLTQQQMPSPVPKQQVSPVISHPTEPIVFVYESRSPPPAPVTTEESSDVSPKRDVIVTKRISPGTISSQSPPVAVQHTVVTRSTPVLHQTDENKSVFVYQQQSQASNSPTSESGQNVVFRQRNTILSTSPVSPTANTNDQGRTQRHSAELKHVERPISHEKRVPHLSPMVVSASTVPMLFQEAMRPKEISLDQEKLKSPTAAPLRLPRSPEKPKPAPRPKSLKSPVSPTSKIPVSVTEKPAHVVKPPARSPSPTAPGHGSFKSSHTLVMATSPPAKQPIVTSPTSQSERMYKIPPPKAPRPARSPVSPPVSSPFTSVTSSVTPAPQSHVVVQRESHTSSLKPTSAVFAKDNRTEQVQGQPSYNKFMYEQPSFLASRTSGSRRSMSRISFTPPKPTTNTRLVTSYIEPSPTNFTESLEAKSHENYTETRVPKSYSDYSVGDRMNVSYTEPARREEGFIRSSVETKDSEADALVRPEQTRTTFGPTFLRLAGDRRSLSSLERKQYSPVQKSQAPKPEPKPFRRDVVFSEGEQSHPFRGQTKVRAASSGSESSFDPGASNIVNRYLMEIKESTELISVPGADISKSAENIANSSTREENEQVQMRRSIITNTEVAQPSRLPIYGTSAYKENEYTRQAPAVDRRQAATLPRNYKGVSMGAVVVEMGPSQPSRVKLGSSQEKIYILDNSASSPGDRRSYSEQTSSRPDLYTPGSRSSYAGFSPGRQYTSPQYSYSEYHVQKQLNTPRDRSSFAGSSSQSTLTPEEMARLKEVLKR